MGSPSRSLTSLQVVYSGSPIHLQCARSATDRAAGLLLQLVWMTRSDVFPGGQARTPFVALLYWQGPKSRAGLELL